MEGTIKSLSTTVRPHSKNGGSAAGNPVGHAVPRSSIGVVCYSDHGWGGCEGDIEGDRVTTAASVRYLKSRSRNDAARSADHATNDAQILFAARRKKLPYTLSQLRRADSGELGYRKSPYR